MVTWIYNFIVDEFLVVTLPRTLVLHNRRLGTFYKLLQLLFVIMVIVYCIFSRVFLLSHTVEAWGVNIWPEETSSSVGARAGANRHGLAAHCTNPAAYAYAHETGVTHYEPTSCKPLSTGEAYSSLMDGAVFLATFAADSTIWEGAGSQCGPSAERECAARNATKSARYQEAGGGCSCTIREHFLVQNAEQQRLRIVFGYEVDLSAGRRLDIRRGGIVAQTSSDLQTTFRAADGGLCHFGGRSEWKLSEAAGGISGTVHELLHCAGVTLDSNPESLLAGATLPSSPPHLRTQGVRLELHMDFREDLLGHMFCDVRVVGTPVATAVWTRDVQPWGGIGSASAQHSRRAHGIALSARVSGTIYTFSWVQVVRGFVDITVVLQIPRFIIYIISMYMMGLVSEIYRGSAKTKLNIFGKFHGSVAKLILAEVAFRGLVGDWNNSRENLPGITPKMMFKRLQSIFQAQLDSGILDENELLKMTAVIFNLMDKDGGGRVCCGEFIEACTDDGELNLNRMAQFFDEDRKISYVRRFFDNTHKLSEMTHTNAISDTAMQEFTMEARAKTPHPERKLDERIEAEESDEQHPPPKQHQVQQQQQHSGWGHELAQEELRQRMHELEIYCEERLGVLKAAVTSDASASTSGVSQPMNKAATSCGEHTLSMQQPKPPDVGESHLPYPEVPRLWLQSTKGSEELVVKLPRAELEARTATTTAAGSREDEASANMYPALRFGVFQRAAKPPPDEGAPAELVPPPSGSLSARRSESVPKSSQWRSNGVILHDDTFPVTTRPRQPKIAARVPPISLRERAR